MHSSAQLAGFWARQLHAEFQDICWQYSIKLLPPVFEISQARKQVGVWQAESRTIKISSFLIRNYSWAVTINVLKHEIAHQICSELFKSPEVAHGDDFKRACALLGLPEEYWRAGGDLPENIDLADNGLKPTSKGRRFIDRVEKLLALAESANENESALAMQKANELIEKYHILQLDTEQEVRYTYAIINKKKRRLEPYQRQICRILQDFFYVSIVNSYLYDPHSNQTHKTIELLGSQENVSIAEYGYYFLENQLSALWSQNKSRYRGKTITEKNSYYLGLLNGFYNKLQAQKGEAKRAKQVKASVVRAEQNTAFSLIVGEDKRLAEYVGRRFPRLRKRARRGAKIYKSTYEEGFEVGQKITLHKGVTKQEGNRGKRITHIR
jgi:hypothetical protein